MSAVATRAGLKASDLRNIFDSVCTGFRENAEKYSPAWLSYHFLW
jgi:hypothetical protein